LRTKPHRSEIMPRFETPRAHPQRLCSSMFGRGLTTLAFSCERT
jgi:hypothetical protein